MKGKSEAKGEARKNKKNPRANRGVEKKGVRNYEASRKCTETRIQFKMRRRNSREERDLVTAGKNEAQQKGWEGKPGPY